YLTPYWSQYFRANLTYSPSLETMSPGELMSLEAIAAAQNIAAAQYTDTGIGYRNAILNPSDTAPPSSPPGLRAGTTAADTMAVLWSPTSDNVGVAGYTVYRNGQAVGTTAQLQFKDTGLSQGVTYAYTVVAFDASGNRSAPSAPVYASTADVTAPSTPTGLTG